MSELKNFRSAFRGFNRQDVVNYIEYINNTHNAQVEQLNNQLQAALARPTDEEMKAKLEAAEARLPSGGLPSAPSCGFTPVY